MTGYSVIIDNKFYYPACVVRFNYSNRNKDSILNLEFDDELEYWKFAFYCKNLCEQLDIETSEDKFTDEVFGSIWKLSINLDGSYLRKYKFEIKEF